MKLHLQRFASRENTTLGALFDITDTRKFLCFVLEDEFRQVKVKGETRIPDGTYEVALRKVGGFNERYQKRFPSFHKGMLWLLAVPNFEFILIHCGNHDEDTEGCLLVGDDAHFDPEGGDSWIAASTAAYQRIYPSLAAAAEAHNLSIKVEAFA